METAMKVKMVYNFDEPKTVSVYSEDDMDIYELGTIRDICGVIFKDRLLKFIKWDAMDTVISIYSNREYIVRKDTDDKIIILLSNREDATI